MCKIWLKVPRKMNPPVFIYYGLTDFYQNHRRYMVSSDERQLKGEYFKDANELDQNCEPLLFASSQGGRERLTEVKVESETYQVLNKAQIYPCGLKANSMFSGTNVTSLLFGIHIHHVQMKFRMNLHASM